MNFIGSKDRLIQPLILKAMKDQGIEPTGRFGDAFAGTHAVGMAMQKLGMKVYANDTLTFSQVIGRARLNTVVPSFDVLRGDVFPKSTPKAERLAMVLDHLNFMAGAADADWQPEFPGRWFVDKYGEGGADGRLYFSEKNAKAIQVVRGVIDEWELTYDELCVLVASLVVAADKVSNVASVYYSYLKALKPSAKRDLVLDPIPVVEGERAVVTGLDVVEFASRTEDLKVLYLDPPYNNRQYGPNYHILETIAAWDDPVANGKGGVRPYANVKSKWCSKRSAIQQLKDVLYVTTAEWVMMSYSDEGIMATADIEAAMSEFGKPIRYDHRYKRFRSDKDGDNRKYDTEDGLVTEHLFMLKKETY